MPNVDSIPKNTIAFVSYVRDDDKNCKGIITKFRDELDMELKVCIGPKVNIFQDTKNINYGDRFWEKIVQYLKTTPFLIPILTPSYFNSNFCMKELRSFIKFEKNAGYNDHIVPIRLIEFTDEVHKIDRKLFRDLDSRLIFDLTHFEKSRRLCRKDVVNIAESIRIRYRTNFQSGLHSGEGKGASGDASYVMLIPKTIDIPSGEFMMGSLKRDKMGKMTERPRHKVRINYNLKVGIYPVTFEEWDSFWKYCNTNGDFFQCVCQEFHKRGYSNKEFSPTIDSLLIHDERWGRGKRPLINVSWYQAQTYLIGLSLSTKKNYRLLSESEWEYCCRAGSSSRYSFGEDITKEDANFGWINGKTTLVTTSRQNKFGLYHMHGQVWELVEDVYHDSYEGAPDDGRPWLGLRNGASAFLRVVRGGSWKADPITVRSAARGAHFVTHQIYNVGFRVACDLAETSR